MNELQIIKQTLLNDPTAKEEVFLWKFSFICHVSRDKRFEKAGVTWLIITSMMQ